MGSLKVKLLTGRSLSQGKTKVAGKLSEDYMHSTAICEIDPEDLKVLGISPGTNVKVITSFGQVVLRSVSSTQAPHRGIIFIPYGPWASLVMDPTTHGTSMPSLKGIEAEVVPVPEERILSINELVARIKEG
jgi:formylmethanofuran dehydrogenase subunit D